MQLSRLRFILSISVGGFALLFLFVGSPVHAAAHICPDDPFYCNVPAPTVIQPAEGKVYTSPASVLFTGLSWNETKVDIYIDGAYSGRAALVTDPSEVGNFFYRPAVSLKPGMHTMYTVARNLSEFERSIDSPKISFTVLVPKPIAKPASNAVNPTDLPTSTPSGLAPVATTTQSANSILDWFFHKDTGSQASTTSGSPTFTETTMGRALLVFAIVIILVSALLYISRPKYEEPLPYDTKKKDEGPPTAQN